MREAKPGYTYTSKRMKNRFSRCVQHSMCKRESRLILGQGGGLTQGS